MTPNNWLKQPTLQSLLSQNEIQNIGRFWGAPSKVSALFLSSQTVAEAASPEAKDYTILVKSLSIESASLADAVEFLFASLVPSTVSTGFSDQEAEGDSAEGAGKIKVQN